VNRIINSSITYDPIHGVLYIVSIAQFTNTVNADWMYVVFLLCVCVCVLVPWSYVT